MNKNVTSGSKDIDKKWKLVELDLCCRSFLPPVTTGFIQASLSKIQRLFKDFDPTSHNRVHTESLSKIQGLLKASSTVFKD